MTSTNVSLNEWVSEPDGRGTWSILSTCLLTISLCCWSSVYPNIPSRSDGEFRQFLYKFYLLSIGILGPEILLFIALGQWTSARTAVKVCIPFLTAVIETGLRRREIPCSRIYGLDKDACLFR
jgi:hypothetical protein